MSRIKWHEVGPWSRPQFMSQFTLNSPAAWAQRTLNLWDLCSQSLPKMPCMNFAFGAMTCMHYNCQGNHSNHTKIWAPSIWAIQINDYITLVWVCSALIHMSCTAKPRGMPKSVILLSPDVHWCRNQCRPDGSLPTRELQCFSQKISIMESKDSINAHLQNTPLKMQFGRCWEYRLCAGSSSWSPRPTNIRRCRIRSCTSLAAAGCGLGLWLRAQE